MKFLLLLLSLLALVSCESHKGKFTSHTDTTFTGKKYLFGSAEEIKIARGTYNANLTAGFNNKLTLEITKDKETSHSIVFKIPEGFKFPDENGELSLTSYQIEQPYDIYSKVETTYTNSDTINTWESCTYTTFETVCRHVCSIDSNGTQVCSYICREESVTHHGTHEVYYFIQTSDKNIKIDLITNTDVVADFQSFERTKSKIYEYMGRCY